MIEVPRDLPSLYIALSVVLRAPVKIYCRSPIESTDILGSGYIPVRSSQCIPAFVVGVTID